MDAHVVLLSATVMVPEVGTSGAFCICQTELVAGLTACELAIERTPVRPPPVPAGISTRRSPFAMLTDRGTVVPVVQVGAEVVAAP